MGTLPTAILTNGRGEFFLDQVAEIVHGVLEVVHLAVE